VLITYCSDKERGWQLAAWIQQDTENRAKSGSHSGDGFLETSVQSAVVTIHILWAFTFSTGESLNRKLTVQERDGKYVFMYHKIWHPLFTNFVYSVYLCSLMILKIKRKDYFHKLHWLFGLFVLDNVLSCIFNMFYFKMSCVYCC